MARDTTRNGWVESGVCRNRKSFGVNGLSLVAAGGVAAEEGIGLPVRAGVGVGHGDEQLAHDFLVDCGGGVDPPAARDRPKARDNGPVSHSLKIFSSGEPGSKPTSSFTAGIPWRMKLY